MTTNAAQPQRTVGFLGVPATTPEAQQMFDVDVGELGYVMSGTRLWGYQPATVDGLFELMRQANVVGRFSFRDRAVMVAAGAAAFGDSYCSLAWGSKLAAVAGAEVAADVIAGRDRGLDDRERAMARWARAVVRDPSGTTAKDVEPLREAGFSDAEIFAMTVFVAMRVAFSTVNDALGLQPDAELRDTTPAPVLAAVRFGRPIAEAPDAQA
jgi:uncharacterized protein YciW